MAYSEFTLSELTNRFGLDIETHQDLFERVAAVPVDPVLRTVIDRHLPVAVNTNTEKVRAELLIAPVLVEVLRLTGNRISFYSGADFNVDREARLTGEADFLFTRGPQVPEVSAPVVVVVEAKKENIGGAYGQCGAEMVAARQLNERAKTGVASIYGCITIGDQWKFLVLENDRLRIDRPTYTMHQLDRILGILLHMVGFNPLPA